MRTTSSPRSVRLQVALALVLLSSACATPAQRGEDTATGTMAPENDLARLARLEREARALARTTGCDSTSSCRTAPVGWRGCGGPRTYLVYCAATTDSVALYRKLEELKQNEVDYNAKSGMMSTCEMRLPPNVTLSGGNCRESR